MKSGTKRIGIVAAVSIALIGGCAQTPQKQEAAPTGGSVGVGKYTPYTRIVDYAYVKPHATPPIDRKKNAAVFDSRPVKRYDIGHLPGAINLVEPLFEKQKTLLPADKAKEIIFYCQGHSCELSHSSAYKAEKLGYTNIKVYAAGVPDWQAKGEPASVSTAFINKALADKADIVLIDSRPDKTVAKGTIPGAFNIPDNKFDKMKDKLPADKAKQIIFFCGGLICDLSEKSARKAKALGYQNVRTYAEGYPAWAAANKAKPMAAAPAAAAAAPVASDGGFRVETTSDKEVISTPFFERIVNSDPSKVTIIDVRKADTCKAGTWPTALCIPLDQLEGKLASLPKDKPIVFTCGTGAQASMAYDLFEEKGYKNAYILDAEVELVNGKIQIKK